MCSLNQTLHTQCPSPSNHHLPTQPHVSVFYYFRLPSSLLPANAQTAAPRRSQREVHVMSSPYAAKPEANFISLDPSCNSDRTSTEWTPHTAAFRRDDMQPARHGRIFQELHTMDRQHTLPRGQRHIVHSTWAQFTSQGEVQMKTIFVREPTFRRKASPPSSGLKSAEERTSAHARTLAYDSVMGFMLQKTSFFTVTAVKTSNLT
jgi:ADP-ribose pyrophosphatase YjhB (NUDIX family)